MAYDWISFTTDYGHDDGFVAACEGVIGRVCPAARVLHVTHTVPPQHVRRGAAVLAQTVPYLPAAVHLAVVDPGVGTARRAIALETVMGLLVGPDNGLLVPAAEALGGIRAAHELRAEEFRLSTVSATFHGRDVFAPAAAYLARGVPIDELGPAVDPATLVRFPEPSTIAERGRITTEVLGVDTFGNIQLAADGSHVDSAGARRGTAVLVHLGGRTVPAALSGTFGDVGDGQTVVYLDSAGRLAIAVNGGSAAGEYGGEPGEPVVLLFEASAGTRT
jgi:S-adenosylmethionine hydrolase